MQGGDNGQLLDRGGRESLKWATSRRVVRKEKGGVGRSSGYASRRGYLYLFSSYVALMVTTKRIETEVQTPTRTSTNVRERGRTWREDPDALDGILEVRHEQLQDVRLGVPTKGGEQNERGILIMGVKLTQLLYKGP